MAKLFNQLPPTTHFTMSTVDLESVWYNTNEEFEKSMSSISEMLELEDDDEEIEVQPKQVRSCT